MSSPPARQLAELVGKMVDRRIEGARVVRPALVRGRNTDGTAQLEYLDGTCVARGAREPGQTGSIVTQATADFRSRGTAGLGANRSGQVAALWLDRLEPRVLHPGTDVTVTAYGAGFTAATRFDLLLPSSEFLHPFIDVLAVRLISSEEAELDLRIGNTAPYLRGGGVSYGRSA